MLFELKSEQSRIRIVGVGGLVQNPGGSISVNEDDVQNVVDGASLSFDLKDPSKFDPILAVGTVISSSSNFNSGTLALVSSSSNKKTVVVIPRNSASNGETFFDALNLCVDTTVTSRVLKNVVRGQKRQGGTIAVGRIASDGTVTRGKGDFTCSKTATGTYEIGFRRKNFGRVPLVLVQTRAESSTINGARVAAKTINGCTVYTATANTNTSVDSEFDILLYGFQAMDDYGRARAVMNCTKRKGRLEIHRIANTTHSFGSSVASLVAGGNGAYDLTHRNPFRYAPHVFTMCVSNRIASVQPTTSTGAITSIRTYQHSTGGAVDSPELNALVIGFDDPSEY